VYANEADLYRYSQNNLVCHFSRGTESVYSEFILARNETADECSLDVRLYCIHRAHLNTRSVITK